jgi:iron complex transport system substrate-binding protein
MRSPARAKQSQETCPNAASSFGRLAQRVFRPQWEFSFSGKRSRRQPAAFCAGERRRVLFFEQKHGLGGLALSPRSGRSVIAQRFIAGCSSRLKKLVREADGRSLFRWFLSPVSRAQGQDWSRHPSTESAGLFSFVRYADSNTKIILIGILAIVLNASCSLTPNPNSTSLLTEPTREVVDETGRRINVPMRIDRIVSLAPNLTEIVYAVGAGDRLVGDTTYCDYPTEAKSVAKVGDTMQPSIERIVALKPQIVLVSTASQLEAFTKQLDEQKIAVYVTNPRRLDEVFHSIETLGELFSEHDRSASLAADLRKRAGEVEAAVKQVKPVTVFYQVSGEPLYTIGRESYLTDLVFSDEAALAARPEAVILSTGGSMGEANSTVASSLKNSPAVLNNRVYRIDGDHLSRPGPRLVDGLEEMARALHPEAFK